MNDEDKDGCFDSYELRAALRELGNVQNNTTIIIVIF